MMAQVEGMDGIGPAVPVAAAARSRVHPTAPVRVGLQHALDDDDGDEPRSRVALSLNVEYPLTKEMAVAYRSRHPTLVHLSCFHGSDEEWIDFKRVKWGAATDKPVEELYLRAVNRLPLDEMPTLFQAMYLGGHCVGLLDPISNIIFNTISFFARVRTGVCPLPEGTSHWMSSDAYHRGAWSLLAYRSYNGMVAFMKAFFPRLSEELARLYLHLSCGDLMVAIRLVELELSATVKNSQHHSNVLGSHPEAFFERARFALKIAAVTANHPMPDDILLICHPCLSLENMRSLLSTLESGRRLTVHDIHYMVEAIGSGHREASTMLQVTFPSAEIVERSLASEQSVHYNFDGKDGGGYFSATLTFQRRKAISLAHLRTPKGISLKVRGCLDAVQGYSSHMPMDVSYAPDRCRYIQGLKLGLLEIIHGFYIEALAKLPDVFRQHLLHGIMLAGHCYGPLDPVANIVLHAVWYNCMVNGPWCYMTDSEVDILHGSALLRLEVRSLDGLIAGVSAITGFSEHEAVQYICTKGCRVPLVVERNSDVLGIVSAAAKHPMKEYHARFLSYVCETEMSSKLRRHLCGTREFRAGQLKKVQRMFEYTYGAKLKLNFGSAGYGDLDELTKIAATRVKMQLYLRKEIGELLSNYADQHPWEPKYMLEIICGVEKHYNFLSFNCYHINFLASACDGGTSLPCMLFFAQVSEAKESAEECCSGFGVRYTESCRSFCCPLPHYTSNNPFLGRCSICEPRMHFIVHPSSNLHVGAEARNDYPSVKKLISYADAVDMKTQLCDDPVDFHLGKLLGTPQL